LKKSRYFSDLIKSYNDEIEDLVSDSEGKTVLQKRLNDKRSVMKDLLAMIEFSPEMVAVVFYGAFTFKSSAAMQQLVASEPGHASFADWNALKPELTIAPWAESLIATTLKAPGGDEFLVVTAALEFLRLKDNSTPAAAEPEREEKQGHAEGDDDEADGDDAHDLGEAGADWLAEQGFDAPDR
jgi:hypothetical protein